MSPAPGEEGGQLGTHPPHRSKHAQENGYPQEGVDEIISDVLDVGQHGIIRDGGQQTEHHLRVFAHVRLMHGEDEEGGGQEKLVGAGIGPPLQPSPKKAHHKDDAHKNARIVHLHIIPLTLGRDVGKGPQGIGIA